jgi:hypothetical protein
MKYLACWEKLINMVMAETVYSNDMDGKDDLAQAAL